MPSLRSLVVRAGIAFVLATIAAAVILSQTLRNGPVPMHVRWKPGITDQERAALEQRYRLTEGQSVASTTWAYELADTSTDNIRAMVKDPNVEDTADINRVRFRPRFSNDRQRRLIAFSVAAGLVGAIAAVVGAVRRSLAAQT